MANELLVIEIKASGLCDQSYPISIGIAGADDLRWSWLVYPLETWSHWDPQAEKAHGITRNQLLEQGRDGFIICKEMNAIFRGMTLTCPSLRTKILLERIYLDLGISMSFNLAGVINFDGHQPANPIELCDIRRSLKNIASEDAAIYREHIVAIGIS